jgi:ATP-binding cassette subfamily F protein 3
MLVSHDRALLREVCDEFWLVSAGGVEPFDGDLDDYQRWLLDVSRAAVRGIPAPPRPTAAAAVSPPSAAPAARRDDRKADKMARVKLAERTRPLRVELQQIDTRLAKLGDERKEAEAALAGATLGPADIADAGRRLNHVAAEVAMLEERWLEVSAQLEALNASGA